MGAAKDRPLPVTRPPYRWPCVNPPGRQAAKAATCLPEEWPSWGVPAKLRESPAITTVPDLLAELTGIELDGRIASGAGHSSVGTLQLGREYHTTLFIP